MRTTAYLSTLLTSLLTLDLAAAASVCPSNSIQRLYKEKYSHLTGAACGCGLLSELLPSQGAVHLPGTTTYTDEKNHYWSGTARLSPGCVFTPASPKEVSIGITVAKLCKSEFNMRGAGHMPIAGAANTDGGILFGMSKFTSVELSKKNGGKSVFVGPGRTWGDVYKYLAQYGLYCIGGRLSAVGVPGLILGGGLNYFANKYGFSMDNVLSYEVVLANGDIVVATESNKYRDLFWALKGGSGQFGIVTKFELKTYEIPKVWSGMSMFASTTPNDPGFGLFYSAITNLTNSGYTDRGVGLISQVSYVPAGVDTPAQAVAMAVQMHEGDEEHPEILSDFDNVPWMDIPGRTVPYNITSPVYMSEVMGQFEPSDNRYLFHVEASVATPEAVRTMHDVFFNHTSKLATMVPTAGNIGVAIQGIPRSTIAVGKSDPAKLKGNAFGLVQGKSQIWYCLSLSWTSSSDDAGAEAWATEFGDNLVTALKKRGQLGNDGRGFQYLNDAQGNQDVYSKYGKNELKKLKEIREKYDPKGKVFGKGGLVKGGFKF